MSPASEIANNANEISKNTQKIDENTNNISLNTREVASISSRLDSQDLINASLRSDYSSGISMAIAMGHIEVSHEGFSVGVGSGSFNGKREQAIGIGYGGSFKNTNFIFKASRTSESTGVGITFKF